LEDFPLNFQMFGKGLFRCSGGKDEAMKANSWILAAVLAAVIVGVGWLVLSRLGGEDSGVESASEAAPLLPSDPADTPAAPVLTPVPVAGNPEVEAVMIEPARSAFLETPMAKNWMEEEGYTEEEILQAQATIRANGYSESMTNESSLVRRHLPPRYNNAIQVDDIQVPARVKAGEPIPYTVIGRSPGEGFEFLRFRALVQGSVIRLRGLGFTREPTSGPMTDPIEQAGTLDPLPPGEYQLYVEELGPNGMFPFTVVE
jgi:hypothetical protein